MGAHHYLPFRTLVGRSVRHVAVLGERWLALVGWQAGAFKLRPRDEWIGWLPEQQFRRLHLIANNSRFVILPEVRIPVKLITDSGVKPITDSGQTGHLSERSDAGLGL